MILSRRTVVAAAVAIGLTAFAADPVGATSDASPARFAGPTRIETARLIADATFPQATVAIVVGSRSISDALSASYLSGAGLLPVYLTDPDHVSPGIIESMQAKGVQGIEIIGGTAAVSDVVKFELGGAGFQVDRIAGNDRYETAAAVARLVPAEAIGEFEAGRAAIIAAGDAFADAVAAGPMSGTQKMPILLTQTSALPAVTVAALTDLGIEQVLIVGGTAAVSTSVENHITGMGIPVRRIAGPHRQGTAFQIALVEWGELNYPISTVMIARGDVYADALAGGSRGAAIFAPILLVDAPDSLGVPASDFIRDHSDTIETVEALGGTGAIADSVLAQAVAVARG
jgi:putative cell wall-binding protein